MANLQETLKTVQQQQQLGKQGKNWQVVNSILHFNKMNMAKFVPHDQKFLDTDDGGVELEFDTNKITVWASFESCTNDVETAIERIKQLRIGIDAAEEYLINLDSNMRQVEQAHQDAYREHFDNLFPNKW